MTEYPAVKPKEKRIAIFGFYGNGNFGDEIMLRALVRGLVSDYHLIVAAYDFAPLWIEHELPANVRIVKYGRGDISSSLRSTVKLFREVLWSDLVVYGGGTFLFDNVSASYRNMYGVLRTTLLCQTFRRRLMLLGIGVGELQSARGRKIAKYVLRHANLAAMRDQSSYAEAQELLGYPAKHIKRTADLLFLESQEELQNGRVDQRESPRLTVVFCGMEFFFRQGINLSEDELSSILAMTFDQLVETKNLNISFVPMQLNPPHRDDNRFHHKILMKMTHGDSVQLINDSGDRYTNTLQKLSNADLVVGMRLHSIAAAMACGAPVFGLVLTEKLRRLLQESGLQDFYIEVNQLQDAAQLTALIESVINLVDKGAYPDFSSYVREQRTQAQFNLSYIRKALR